MLIGYQINPDAAQCLDCFEDAGGMAAWHWYHLHNDEPPIIDSVEEASGPAHCTTCAVLLGQHLGPQGLDVVADAVAAALGAGLQSPVTSQWIAEYGDALADDTMLARVALPAADALDAYAAMPRDPQWLTRPDLRVHAWLAGWLEPQQP
jgi:hypothetical protein